MNSNSTYPSSTTSAPTTSGSTAIRTAFARSGRWRSRYKWFKHAICEESMCPVGPLSTLFHHEMRFLEKSFALLHQTSTLPFQKTHSSPLPSSGLKRPNHLLLARVQPH